jgi:hypothetical protein
MGIKIIAWVDCIFGIFVLGWFFEASSKIAGLFNAILSSCPCTILPKIAVLVVLLLIVLLIKSGIQILRMDLKGRDDHISFSSLGIFILLFPALFTHKQGVFPFTAIICGSFIVYLAWSIFYLNCSNIKEQFK